jgi:hypothetical protein
MYDLPSGSSRAFAASASPCSRLSPPASPPTCASFIPDTVRWAIRGYRCRGQRLLRRTHDTRIPACSWAALIGSYELWHAPQPGLFDHPPEAGTLPPELIPRLASALARHTTTPDRCCFAVWNGFGDLGEDVRRAPTFLAPHREYHLLRGPTEAAAESAPSRLASSRRTCGGPTIALGASPLRSTSTARTLAATTRAARKSLRCQRSRRSRSTRQPESTSAATSATPSNSRARTAARGPFRVTPSLERLSLHQQGPR